MDVLPQECTWIADALQRLPADAFPLVNVGSQSAVFRQETQPWLDRELFAPLHSAGRAVVHVDIRPDPGIDLVADINTSDGRAAIQSLIPTVRSVLCSNVLEHVANPFEFVDSCAAIVSPGGYLVLSGPTAYPYHPDPIDTMFRPTWLDLMEQFDDTFSLVRAAQIACGRFASDYASQTSYPHLFARVVSPFFKPARWWNLVRWLPRELQAYGIVLRRVRTDLATRLA